MARRRRHGRKSPEIAGLISASPRAFRLHSTTAESGPDLPRTAGGAPRAAFVLRPAGRRRQGRKLLQIAWLISASPGAFRLHSTTAESGPDLPRTTGGAPRAAFVLRPAGRRRQGRNLLQIAGLISASPGAFRLHRTTSESGPDLPRTGSVKKSPGPILAKSEALLPSPEVAGLAVSGRLRVRIPPHRNRCARRGIISQTQPPGARYARISCCARPGAKTEEGKVRQVRRRVGRRAVTGGPHGGQQGFELPLQEPGDDPSPGALRPPLTGGPENLPVRRGDSR